MTDTPAPDRSYQGLILTLQAYWASKGCVILQPYDMEMGAGTFHPATTLRSLGPKPWKAAYVQPSRRPGDGRYGENPNRFQRYYQFQVILKPAPADILDLYLGSLDAIGLNRDVHDIRFVEDDWESPTLGAWGLGWEVWCDGMEVTQFTYFQQVGGVDCNPVSGEITYGLERLAMYVQGVEYGFDLAYNTMDKSSPDYMTWGDVYHQNEVEQSGFNFQHANTDVLFRQFKEAEDQAQLLLNAPVGRAVNEFPEWKHVLPAYEQTIKASHLFNLLDARGVISVAERQAYIGRVRTLAKACAEAWVKSPQGRTDPRLA